MTDPILSQLKIQKYSRELHLLTNDLFAIAEPYLSRNHKSILFFVSHFLIKAVDDWDETDDLTLYFIILENRLLCFQDEAFFQQRKQYIGHYISDCFSVQYTINKKG